MLWTALSSGLSRQLSWGFHHTISVTCVNLEMMNFNDISADFTTLKATKTL